LKDYRAIGRFEVSLSDVRFLQATVSTVWRAPPSLAELHRAELAHDSPGYQSVGQAEVTGAAYQVVETFSMIPAAGTKSSDNSLKRF